MLVRTTGREAFDPRIDDAWVDLLDLVVAKPQPLDDPWAEVFDEHIGVLDQPTQQVAPTRMLEVARDAALVGIQQQEVERIRAR